MDPKLLSLRMERQLLLHPAEEAEYCGLYRDLQPGLNVYWNGFGQPPVLSFRAGFDDLDFNRERQLSRSLVKGRFVGGNLGWIVPEDMELFAALYRKPLVSPTLDQLRILELIETEGPLNIQQIKSETGLLVKQITPILHRLQEAFLIYEDQYDGEWDRGWYRFGEMFPEADLSRYTRAEALRTLLRRFAYRFVWFDSGMVKSYYRLPEKELRAVLEAMAADGELTVSGEGYLLAADAALLEAYQPQPMQFVYAMHRNDPLYRCQEPRLKGMAKGWTEGLPYDCEPLQYLLIDGEFHGAVVGHFRNGPYDLNDVVCDLPEAETRLPEILEAVRAVNFGKLPARMLGKVL